MIALLALALAAAAPQRAPVVPDQAEFLCDDHPWRSRGCGLTRAERRLGRLSERICGPEGTVDMDPVPGHPDGWPHCSRYGWNGRRYVGRCEGSKQWPLRSDPWLNAFEDRLLKDRRVRLSDERTNSCD